MTSMRWPWALAVLASGTIGCGGASDGPDRDAGLISGGELPPPTTPVYVTGPGGGDSTTDPGCELRASNGGLVRLTWRGSGAQTFRGSVWTTGTFIVMTGASTTNGCALTPDVTLGPVVPVTGGNRIDFTAVAGDVDCIDVQTDVEPLYFDIFLDGARAPARVRYADPTMGGAQVEVGAVPFALRVF